MRKFNRNRLFISLGGIGFITYGIWGMGHFIDWIYLRKHDILGMHTPDSFYNSLHTGNINYWITGLFFLAVISVIAGIIYGLYLICFPKVKEGNSSNTPHSK